MPQRFYLETLGCPKNQVDSEKIVGTLLAEGMVAAEQAADADLVVVNTCAFIEDARQESIDTILALDDARRAGSRLVVTGCLAERYGAELAQALPEADAVAGFGVPVSLTVKPGRTGGAEPRPAQPAPAAGQRAMGLRQDRRGLRPQLRLLRHPQLPGPAAQPHAGVDPHRGRPARRPGDRPGGPGPGVLRQGRAGPRAPARSCRSCGPSRPGCRGSGCSTSTRAT